jgi:hypothetical protein
VIATWPICTPWSAICKPSIRQSGPADYASGYIKFAGDGTIGRVNPPA